MFKKVAKKVLPLLIFFVIFGLCCYFLFSLNVPKTPATIEQVWDVLVSQGYEPQDITEQYHSQEENKQNSSLIQCISMQKEDIYFYFYSFNNRNSATDAYGQFYWDIFYTRMSLPNAETDTKIANYGIYTLKTRTTYSATVYVDVTTVYAYSDVENRGEINKILEAIDYLN